MAAERDACVVDDAQMQITHVIRSEEHLSNTPRQIFILESLGYTRPIYGHVPYVAKPEGTHKLSKRKLKEYITNKGFAKLLAHGDAIADKCGVETDADTFNPVIIDFYREIGFCPEAILNYLDLLGWSLDGEREKFTVQEMIELFSMDRVKSAPASFDPQKLLAFQGDAFAELSTEKKVDLVHPFAQAAGYLDDDGRLMAVFCHNNDIGDGWEREGENRDFFEAFSMKASYPLGINIITYAMTH